MKIVVNDIAASKGGAITILKQFYNYVLENDKTNDYVFLLSDKYLDETSNIKIITLPKIKQSRVKKVIFDCFTGKKFITKLNPDLVISLQNIITFGLKVPQYVYIHQPIPFQEVKNFSFFKTQERKYAIIQKIIGRFIVRSAKKADKVVVQTKWMKEAVSKKAKISEEKITVYFPKADLFKPNKNLFNNRRFLYPTSNDLYKNINIIVKACELLNKEGTTDFEVRLTLKKEEFIHPNIKCIGYIDKEQLEREYQSATLIFPSYIETVGLPLLEAKSCNAYIIASDMPFTHECLDGYGKAFFFKYYDAIQLANIMKQILLK